MAGIPELRQMLIPGSAGTGAVQGTGLLIKLFPGLEHIYYLPCAMLQETWAEEMTSAKHRNFEHRFLLCSCFTSSLQALWQSKTSSQTGCYCSGGNILQLERENQTAPFNPKLDVKAQPRRGILTKQRA